MNSEVTENNNNRMTVKLYKCEQLNKVVVVGLLSMLLGFAYTQFFKKAHAAYGVQDALVTIGVATGIGTVLGLSTIAFYENPPAHLSNAAIGAGVGFIVGLGVATYLLVHTSEQDEFVDELVVPPAEEKPSDEKPAKEPITPGKKTKRKSSSRFYPPQFLASIPTTLTQPRTHLSEWLVAVKVMELRF